jgi:hypothetical protein
MTPRLPLAACVLSAAALGLPACASTPDVRPPPEPVAVTSEQAPWAATQANALGELMNSHVARDFLRAVERLPAGEARTLQRDAVGGWHSETQAAAMDDDERAALEPVELDAQRFYTTKYGTPLAYGRALELLAEHGLDSLARKRVLDFGYGTVGHLRLMALCGADAVGVDVDPFLAALYSEPGDTGAVDGGGSVRLVNGYWPTDESTRAEVGTGFDVFTSKNTLKRGYIHPAREVDPRYLVHLGVDDATYLAQLHGSLAPGALVILYNLCPPQNPDDQPYIPWADGRSPFERAEWEAGGFELLAFDVVDDGPARDMARALGWDQQGMDPETQLFAWYTIARRR